MLVTYDCIHGRSPVYFRDICSLIVSVPFRFRLRSADNDDMIVPRTRTARYGPRSFRVTAPQIWNMLPPHLKNSSSRALRLGSLCKPTHKRRLWELCLSGALQILDLIDWLIDCVLCLKSSDSNFTDVVTSVISTVLSAAFLAEIMLKRLKVHLAL